MDRAQAAHAARQQMITAYNTHLNTLAAAAHIYRHDRSATLRCVTIFIGIMLE